MTLNQGFRLLLQFPIVKNHLVEISPQSAGETFVAFDEDTGVARSDQREHNIRNSGGRLQRKKTDIRRGHCTGASTEAMRTACEWTNLTQWAGVTCPCRKLPPLICALQFSKWQLAEKSALQAHFSAIARGGQEPIALYTPRQDMVHIGARMNSLRRICPERRPWETQHFELESWLQHPRRHNFHVS